MRGQGTRAIALRDGASAAGDSNEGRSQQQPTAPASARLTPLSSDGGRRPRGEGDAASRLDGDAADDDGAGVSGVSQAVRKRARVWPASRESRACTAARGGPRHRPRLAAAGRICAIAAAPPSVGTTELVTWQQIRSCSYQNQCKPSMTPKSATCTLHPGGSARAARGPKFQWPSASF